MRARLALLVLATTASGLVAQNPTNYFYRWDRSTEFTSRGSNGSNAGYVSQGFSHGHSAGLNTLTQTYIIMQDQNPSTQEVYNLGTTELDAAGFPDYANLNYYATNLTLPVNTQTTPAAYAVTLTGLVAAPHNLNLKQCTQWHHVWQFVNATNWTADGLSTHMGQGAPYNSTLLCFNAANHREIPRTEGTAQIIEELGWSAVPAANPNFIDRTWRLRTAWKELVLNGGAFNTTYGGFNGALGAIGCNNTDPNLGYAALHPDFADIGLGNPARNDDYTWLVQAGINNANDFAVLFFANTVFPNGGVPSPFGRLHIDITDPLFNAIGPVVMGALDAGGNGALTLNFGPGNSTLRPIVADFPSWSAQALVFGKNPAELTNLFAFRTKLLPTGFTAGQADAANTAKLPKTITDQTILVRNDGRGLLTVKQTRGTSVFGTADVCERTAVRLILNPAASDVEISTTTTNPVKFVWAYNK